MSDKPSLREVQQWMLSRIHPGLSPVGEGDPLNPQADTPGVERLEVYRSGYTARIHEALREVYAAVENLIGKRRFAGLAEAYAPWYRRADYDLSRTAEGFPTFLAQHLISHAWPFLVDLAHLEWRVDVAFHAQQQLPFDFGLLQHLPLDAWGRKALRFQPAVAVVRSAWPIIELWNTRLTDRAAIDIQIEGRSQQALVYRHAYQVRCLELDAEQAGVLQALIDGQSLGAVCEALTASGKAGLPLSTWLSAWAGLGLITNCQ
jgi:hypothetical protein